MTPYDFGGDTYEPDRDESRLASQLRRTREAMSDWEWHTLGEVSEMTGDPEASVSARLRDLRKAKFGGHQVVSEYVRRGLWRYRLASPTERAEQEFLESLFVR